MGFNERYTKDVNGNNVLAESIPVPDIPFPRWTAMREAMEGDAGINNKLFTQAIGGNGYARLLTLFIQGEMGHGDPAAMQRLLSDRHPQSTRRLVFHPANVDWTTGERNQLNNYFANHDFNIVIVP